MTDHKPDLPKHVAEFCDLCDFKYSYGPCGPDRIRYVARNWCGWSNIQEVHLSEVTREHVKIHPVEQILFRNNIDALMAAIEAEKAKLAATKSS